MNAKHKGLGMSEDELTAVRTALSQFSQFGQLRPIQDEIVESNGDLIVPVEPERYPDRMYDFYDLLARAEMDLRDAGMAIRLAPRIRQRMMFVAELPERPLAFFSVDGNEYEALSRILKIPPEEIVRIIFVGYPFDSEEEREAVVRDIQADYPNAEFNKAS